MARIQIFFIIMIGMTCCFKTIDSAVTAGYFYDNPIRPFNPPSFSSLRSTGHYSAVPYGQKVETTTQARLKVPPIPSLPPLTTYKPAQTTKYQSPYARLQPTLTSYRTTQQQVQRGQGFQQQQKQIPQQQQISQFQRTQQSFQPYSYPKPQVPVSTQFTNNQQNTNNQQSFYTIQQRNNNIPQSTTRPTTTQLYFSSTPTAVPIQRQTPKSPLLTVVPQVAKASVVAIPTTASVINSDSNPTQIVATGLLASPDIYVVDGRQLKQYKVYENIDNDIDQEVHNFIPANFFLNSYHSMIGDTHPLGEDVQVQNRATSFQQSTQQIPRTQQLQQQQQQQTPNTVALGSGGLGFVKLPNGSVYLGSGSLGYISNLQHSQDVQDLRSRTSSSGPDALHFGHGPLSDSFYYQNQKD